MTDLLVILLAVGIVGGVLVAVLGGPPDPNTQIPEVKRLGPNYYYVDAWWTKRTLDQEAIRLCKGRVENIQRDPRYKSSGYVRCIH